MKAVHFTIYHVRYVVSSFLLFNIDEDSDSYLSIATNFLCKRFDDRAIVNPGRVYPRIER